MEMDRHSQRKSQRSIIKIVALLIFFGAIFIIKAIYIDSKIPVFDELLIVYPILALVSWGLVGKDIRLHRDLYIQEGESTKIIGITLGHSVLLFLSVVSYMAINEIISSWYVIFGIYGDFLKEEVLDTVRLLQIFKLIALIVMTISLREYKRTRLEYFSVTIHGLGLVCTLICYISIISSQENLENYASQIMRCEGIYIEGLILASAFLFYCNLARARKIEE